jgi:hypothetical protein
MILILAIQSGLYDISNINFGLPTALIARDLRQHRIGASAASPRFPATLNPCECAR